MRDCASATAPCPMGMSTTLARSSSGISTSSSPSIPRSIDSTPSGVIALRYSPARARASSIAWVFRPADSSACTSSRTASSAGWNSKTAAK